MKKRITYKNETYESKKSCCRALKLNYHTVSHRAQKTSWEKAIEYYDTNREQQKENNRLQCNKAITYNNKTYENKKSCCKALKLRYQAVAMRSRKTSWLEAIAYYDKKPKGFVHKGVTYKTRKECCETLKINYEQALTRAHRSSWEQALDYYENKKITFAKSTKKRYNKNNIE